MRPRSQGKTTFWNCFHDELKVGVFVLSMTLQLVNLYMLLAVMQWRMRQECVVSIPRPNGMLDTTHACYPGLPRQPQSTTARLPVLFDCQCLQTCKQTASSFKDMLLQNTTKITHMYMYVLAFAFRVIFRSPFTPCWKVLYMKMKLGHSVPFEMYFGMNICSANFREVRL